MRISAALPLQRMILISLAHLAGEGNPEQLSCLRNDPGDLIHRKTRSPRVTQGLQPDGTILDLFAHYAALWENGGTLEYHQYHFRSINLTSTYEDYKARLSA
ncbi:hypothetical protein VTK73DRAFT_4977 [Phialemonium thermophilum]|uniref:Uncharacterized protein n=1 Tax=Phialemonium thermophilum TaxID=223376 RepID=A0ABR3XYU0_9PEZI